MTLQYHNTYTAEPELAVTCIKRYTRLEKISLFCLTSGESNHLSKSAVFCVSIGWLLNTRLTVKSVLY